MIHKVLIQLPSGDHREGQCNVRSGESTMSPRVDVDVTIPGLRASLYIETAETLAHDLLAAVALAKKMRAELAEKK